MNHCLDRKIYDRQINKKGIADRVVDESNPDANITFEEMSRLCWNVNSDDNDESGKSDLNQEEYEDIVLQAIVMKLSQHISKPPFLQETMLSDNEFTKLSTDEKIIAFKDYRLLKASQ